VNLGAIQAFVLQLARIAVGGAGVWMLMQPHANETIGWGLLAVSGLSAGIDVAKVSAQLKTTAAAATAAASTTTIIKKQEPTPAPANEMESAG
jgi:hypothetical protein